MSDSDQQIAPDNQDNPTQPDSVEPKTYSQNTKFYKSTNSSLSIILAGPKNGEVQPEMAKFVPYREIYKGDTVKVGYLHTANKKVQDRLRDDVSVTEIKQAEYDEATGEGATRLPS